MNIQAEEISLTLQHQGHCTYEYYYTKLSVSSWKDNTFKWGKKEKSFLSLSRHGGVGKQNISWYSCSRKKKNRLTYGESGQIRLINSIKPVFRLPRKTQLTAGVLGRKKWDFFYGTRIIQLINALVSYERVKLQSGFNSIPGIG